MYKQVFDPVSNSLGLTSIFAALPLLSLFVLLGVVKLRAWVAGLAALVVAIGVAVVVYSMPVGQALDSGLEGAAFGFFPIMWIVINAVWIYNMTVETGHFDVLRRSFAKVSDDQRIQAIIIAFCFGALMEALAGFGTPVAISSVMLIALGFRPIKAATIALVANTAPVAFGALAVPITTLASNAVTNGQFTVDQLGSMVGRQTPLLAVFVPLALVAIVDGRRGVRQTWPAALLCGVMFGIAQYVCSNYISVPLTDIVAALVSALALIGFLRVWQPSEHYEEEPYADEPATRGRLTPRPVAGGMSEQVDPDFVGRVRNADAKVVDPPREVARAYAPYLIIIAIFALAQLPFLKGTAPTKVGESGTGLESVTRIFHWPGLDLLTSAGKPQSLMNFKFNILSAAGTLLLIAGLVTMLAIGAGLRRALHAYAATLNQLKWAIVTVMAVLALAYVMNASGQTGTLGRWMAGAGGFFAFLSPILGWLGVAVTGSDTSSNALFGGLQVTAAKDTGLSGLLLAASNSSGGVLGKMISPQNLAIAAAAVGLEGREGDLFRRVLFWSVGFLLFMCVLVYLQSTSVLSWMVPGG